MVNPIVGILYGFVTLTYQIVFMIVPLRITIQNSMLSWVSPALAIIGFVLMLLSMFGDFKRYRQKEMRIPWLLILVLLLSTIANYDRGMKENVRTIIWQANLLLFVFSSYIQMGKISLNNDKHSGFSGWISGAVRRTVFFLLLIIDIAAAGSLFQYFQLYYKELVTTDDVYHLGLFEGRLFGVFSTPYSAALIHGYAAVIGLFYVVFLRRGMLLFAIVSCLLSATMVILSGTRSVMLGILLSIAVVAAMILIQRNYETRGNKKGFLRATRAILFAFCLSSGVYFVQLGYGKTIQLAAAWMNGLNGESNHNSYALNQEWLIQNNIARKDNSGNIASNRFGIWQDYVYILTDRPEKLLLGYSPCGYMEYINNHYPDLFIVQYFKRKYPFYYRKHAIYDPHNSILNVLISTGLSGLFLVGTFAVGSVKQIAERFRFGTLESLDYCLLVMLITSVTAMMFESDVFYQCNTTSVAFWMMMGIMHGRYQTGKDRYHVNNRQNYSQKN